jgi:hypothetical protein
MSSEKSVQDFFDKLEKMKLHVRESLKAPEESSTAWFVLS